MDKLLESLYNKGLFTDIECRIVVSNYLISFTTGRQLVISSDRFCNSQVSAEGVNKKTAATNEILKYKTDDEVDVVTEMLNKVNIAVEPLRKSELVKCNELDEEATPGRNPFMIELVFFSKI